jgi:hypothetical protein
MLVQGDRQQDLAFAVPTDFEFAVLENWALGSWALGSWALGSWALGSWALGSWALGSWALGSWTLGIWAIVTSWSCSINVYATSCFVSNLEVVLLNLKSFQVLKRT